MKMKLRKMTTLASSGIELIRADTIFLILGRALMVLSGLKTLRILRTFRSIIDSCYSVAILEVANSNNPAMTMIKSRPLPISLK